MESTGKERPELKTILRSAEYKLQLSAASEILLANMVRIPDMSEEELEYLSVKHFKDRRSHFVSEDFDIGE